MDDVDNNYVEEVSEQRRHQPANATENNTNIVDVAAARNKGGDDNNSTNHACLEENDSESTVVPLYSTAVQTTANLGGQHILLPTLQKHRVQCHLCLILDASTQRKCNTNCTACGVGFHVSCFAAYHYREAMQQHKPAMHKAVETEVNSYTRRYKKRKCMATITDLQLPSL